MARFDNIEELEPDHRGAGLRIGIVMSRFNAGVSEGLVSSCTATLLKQGVAGVVGTGPSLPSGFWREFSTRLTG